MRVLRPHSKHDGEGREDGVSEDARHYGFLSNVMESGDLLPLLGVSEPASADYRRFQTYIKNDPYLTALDNDEHTIQMRSDSDLLQLLTNRAALSQLSPNTLEDTFKEPPVCNAGRDVCIIAGSSPALDRRLLSHALSGGHYIISLGHSIIGVPRPNVWMGMHSPAAYPAYPFISTGIEAKVHEDRGSEEIWVNGAPGLYALSCPNTSTLSPLKKSFAVGQPAVCDLTTESTLATALTYAVTQGFTQIVLTGVSLEGGVDSFYFFNETPHALTYEAKQMRFRKLREVLPPFCRQLRDECGIRIISTYDLNLDGIYYIPGQRLYKRLAKPGDGIKGAAILGITMPGEIKQQRARELELWRDAQVQPEDLSEHVEQLGEMLPAYFTPELVAEHLSKRGQLKEEGCTDCSARAIGAPVLAAFIEAYEKDTELTEHAWRETIPHKWTLLVRGEFRIRSDREQVTNNP
jgi:hypothetical protein